MLAVAVLDQADAPAVRGLLNLQIWHVEPVTARSVCGSGSEHGIMMMVSLTAAPTPSREKLENGFHIKSELRAHDQIRANLAPLVCKVSTQRR